MTIEHILAGEPREKKGTAECRRLRKQGMVPCNIHGHGQDSIAIKVPVSGLNGLISTGTRLFDLSFSGQTETVMFQAVQWDAFGIEMQHVDFLRVDATERVVVEIPVDIRGNAPGALAGGVFEQPLRRLEVECLAAAIPDSIPVRIGTLEIGDAIHVRDLQLAAGVVFTTDADAIVCQVSEPVAELEEEDDLEPGAVEPEVIGRKSDDDGGEDAS
jgi:large subunit ribosomal protein L25